MSLEPGLVPSADPDQYLCDVPAAVTFPDGSTYDTVVRIDLRPIMTEFGLTKLSLADMRRFVGLSLHDMEPHNEDYEAEEV